MIIHAPRNLKLFTITNTHNCALTIFFQKCHLKLNRRVSNSACVYFKIHTWNNNFPRFIHDVTTLFIQRKKKVSLTIIISSERKYFPWCKSSFFVFYLFFLFRTSFFVHFYMIVLPSLRQKKTKRNKFNRLLTTASNQWKYYQSRLHTFTDIELSYWVITFNNLFLHSRFLFKKLPFIKSICFHNNYLPKFHVPLNLCSQPSPPKTPIFFNI